jgi:hypothetical protein
MATLKLITPPPPDPPPPPEPRCVIDLSLAEARGLCSLLTGGTSALAINALQLESLRSLLSQNISSANFQFYQLAHTERK